MVFIKHPFGFFPLFSVRRAEQSNELLEVDNLSLFSSSDSHVTIEHVTGVKSLESYGEFLIVVITLAGRAEFVLFPV